jgi:hypothetical protein
MPIFEQLLEIAGALMILGAFALAQFRGLDRDGYPFLLLNFAGGSILTVIAAVHQQWGLLLVQAVWAIVAAWGLVSVFRASKGAA